MTIKKKSSTKSIKLDELAPTPHNSTPTHTPTPTQILQSNHTPLKAPNISTKTYRSLKHHLKHLESTNYDSIFMIPCSGNSGWYEIAEHSALFYYYAVCQHPAVSLKPNFYSDEFSFYDQYKIGYLRTQHIEDIRANIKKSGLYASESLDGVRYTFKLSVKYTDAKIKEFNNLEHTRRINNLTPGHTDNLDPTLHQTLANTSARLHRLCNSHLDKLSSHVNGAHIITLIDDLLRNYHKLTYYNSSRHANIKSTLEQMRKNIYYLTIEIQTLGEAKLWDLEICASFATPLEQMRQSIENNLKNFLKNGKL